MQILNFLITILAGIGVGVILFFFLIVGLNGYSEQQATPGLILYIVWALFFSLAAAILSVLTAKYLINKKSFSALGAVAIAAPIFIIVVAAANFAGIFASIFLIEALR
jgi:hypothetical protein